MRAVCISNRYCQYKSDTGYCGYTGMGCAKDAINTMEITKDSPMVIVKQVELTDECIQRIAEEVVKKLKRY